MNIIGEWRGCEEDYEQLIIGQWFQWLNISVISKTWRILKRIFKESDKQWFLKLGYEGYWIYDWINRY